MAASATRAAIKRIERIASSLAGMTCVIGSGSQLVSTMAMMGRPNLKALDRTAVKVHGPIPTKATTNN